MSRIKNLKMTWIDVIIIVVLLGAAFLGFKIGVISTAFASGAFIVATVVGARASVMFAERLGELFKNPDMGYIISFLAAFALVFIGLIFIGNAISRIVKATPLEWIDSWIGSILGLLAGIILIGLVIVYLTKFPTANSEQWIEESLIIPVVRAIISPIFREFLRKSDIAVPLVASVLW